MIRRVIRRLGALLVSLLVASIVIFVLLNLLPGNVAQVILGADDNPDAIAKLSEELELDKNPVLRYFDWLAGIVTGDFGRSALTGQPVSQLIMTKLGVTCWLGLFGMTLALVISINVGMFTALKRRNISGFIVSSLSQIGMAIPAFLMGLILIVIFAVKLHWLPAGAYVALKADPARWIKHLILPVVSLALVQSAILTRYVRSAFVEVMNEDYYRTARAVGWTKQWALIRHGLRNASLAIVTVLGMQVATLFVGAIVIEYVFVLPGLGSQLLNSVSNRDLPVVQSIVMVLVFLVLTINAIVDISYQLLDPRLRGVDEAEPLHFAPDDDGKGAELNDFATKDHLLEAGDQR